MKKITATITKVSSVKSMKHAGNFYYIFFKGEDGKSYKTCVDPAYKNYQLWKPLCENPEYAVGVICEGLVVKANGLIDADYLEKTRMAKEVV